MKLPYAILFTLFFFIHQTGLIAQIILSEIISKNESSLLVKMDKPDWIELYNESNNSVSLNGYFLSDSPTNPNKWAFPDCIIAPKTYLIILADGLDKKEDYLHTNFKISSEGETIILSNPATQFVESVELPKLDSDISYAKINEVWSLANPTPKFSNEGQEIIQLKSPSFRKKSGLYNSEFSLQITHNQSDVSISYYLNDLANPININSNKIEIPIENSSIICAKANKNGYLSSKLSCQSFLLHTNHQLPVLSIIGNQDDLFDEDKGLFELGLDAEKDWPFWGANFWLEKELEVHFQYFNADKDSIFYGHADLEMHGGRESRTNPQKTFRLKAKTKYQQPYFNHAFFPNRKNVQQYKRLVVRNASGDFNAGHCRDGFLQDYLMKSRLDLDGNSYQPIAVYINGAYYGLMGLREKMDKYYTWSNYNTTNIDLLEDNGVLLEGDTQTFHNHYQYILNNDLGNTANYDKAIEYFDIKNLTDYFIAQIGNVSTAWPQNNIKYWRPKESSAIWRYLLYDMDIALGRHEWTLASENALLNKMTAFGNSNTFINTINAFLKNEHFKKLFLNRHQDLYNTVLSTEDMLPAFDAFISTIESEMLLHLNRWPTKDFLTWKTEELEKIRNFIQERPAYTMQYFNDYFNLNGMYQIELSSSHPNLVKLDLNSLKNLSAGFKGKYFRSIPITITSHPISNLHFSHWEIFENNQIMMSFQNPFESTFSTDTQLKAIYTERIPDFSAKIIQLDEQKLILNLKAPKAEVARYHLVDLLGRNVGSGKFPNIKLGNNLVEISLPSLLNGMYLLNFQQGNNMFSLKLLK